MLFIQDWQNDQLIQTHREIIGRNSPLDPQFLLTWVHIQNRNKYIHCSDIDKEEEFKTNLRFKADRSVSKLWLILSHTHLLSTYYTRSWINRWTRQILSNGAYYLRQRGEKAGSRQFLRNCYVFGILHISLWGPELHSVSRGGSYSPTHTEPACVSFFLSSISRPLCLPLRLALETMVGDKFWLEEGDLASGLCAS